MLNISEAVLDRCRYRLSPKTFYGVVVQNILSRDEVCFKNKVCQTYYEDCQNRTDTYHRKSSHTIILYMYAWMNFSLIAWIASEHIFIFCMMHVTCTFTYIEAVP